MTTTRLLGPLIVPGDRSSPLYIREPTPAGTGPLGAAQAWWLHHSLEALDMSLRKRQGRLVLASGEALEVLRGVIRKSSADAVYWNRRYDPSGMSIDVRIKAELEKQGIEARSFTGQLPHDPCRLVTGKGTPYRVYTPFWRALESAGEPGSRPGDRLRLGRFCRIRSRRAGLQGHRADDQPGAARLCRSAHRKGRSWRSRQISFSGLP
ncbi:UNVERIFIED_ORG: deoxyribodipyrimidine photolyase [Rhizobium etli]